MIKNKLISDTAITTGTSFLNRFISFVRGFVIARLLDPSLYGYFSGLSLIFLYNAQGHLGILHGMNRNLSLARGAKDFQSFEDIKNNAVSAIIILSFIISIGIVLYSIVKATYYPSYIIWGIRIYAIVGILYHMEYIYHSLLRVDHRFVEINISRIIFASSNFILAVLLIYLFGFYGVLVGLLASMAIQNLYLFFKGKFNLKFRVNFTMIRELIRIGAPISFTYLITVILNSIDRIIIIRFLSPAELGFYGIGLAFSSEFLLRIPDAISYVVYPRILEEYGKSRNTASLLKLFQAPSLVIACIMSVAIGLLFLVIGYVITYLLPSYVPAIQVTKILVFSLFFISINQIAVRVMIATNRTRIVMAFQGMAIVVNLVASYLAVKAGMGISGVALATGFSYFLYSISLTHYTLEKLHGSFGIAIKEQCRLYLPLCYCSIALVLLSYFPFHSSLSTPSVLSDTIVVVSNTLLFVVISIPFLIYIYKSMKQLNVTAY